MITKNLDYQKIYEDIKNYGVCIIPNLFSTSYCSSIREWFDSSYQYLPHELHYDNTEVRIYNSEQYNQFILSYKIFSDKLLSNIFKSKFDSYSILAIRNRELKDINFYSDSRWHIDSFRKQIKTFLFLNDINDNNGAFEYISQSHSLNFKIKMIIAGKYFNFKNLFNGQRAYTCIPNSTVYSLTNKSFITSKVLVKSGTLLVADTSMLHRASPCLKNSRYALTAYYR